MTETSVQAGLSNQLKKNHQCIILNALTSIFIKVQLVNISVTGQCMSLCQNIWDSQRAIQISHNTDDNSLL